MALQNCECKLVKVYNNNSKNIKMKRKMIKIDIRREQKSSSKDSKARVVYFVS